MRITNHLENTSLENPYENASMTHPEAKIEIIAGNALQQKELASPISLKKLSIPPEISKALKIFLESFAKRFENEPSSLFTLSTQVFKEFDPEKGCMVEFRFMSVDKTG